MIQRKMDDSSNYNRGLRQYALGGWLLFLIAPFLLDSFGKVGIVFYFGCVLPWLLLLPKIWQDRQQVLAPIALWAIFCLYLCCSSFWYADASAKESLRLFRYLLFMLCYLSLSRYLIVKTPGLVQLGFYILAIATALHASYSVIQLQELLTPLGRLRGAGAMWNSLVAGNAYALAIIVLVYFLICTSVGSLHSRPIVKLCSIFMLLILSYAVYLTGSRSSMLAALVVIGLMFYFRLRPNQRFMYLTSGLALVCVLVVGAVLYMPEVLVGFKERGFSFRPEIWRYVIQETGSHWLIGQGYHPARIPIADDVGWVSHAHNLFLSVYRYGGLIGTVALTSLLLLTFIIKIRREQSWSNDISLWVLLFGILVCTVNGKFPIDRPGWIWLIFWIPLCIVLADIKLGDGYREKSLV
ncbi:MAG: O-antigen ligase family protein [Pseudomonadales bacterium]|nr:O-antigen ligase family protein [Pseudomonadales bacterium]